MFVLTVKALRNLLRSEWQIITANLFTAKALHGVGLDRSARLLGLHVGSVMAPSASLFCDTICVL